MADHTADKAALLAGAETELTALKQSLAGLDEAALTEVWCGTWSVRDILAHMVGWHRELIPALERLTRGERPVPEGTDYSTDVDAWNARFVEARRDWTAQRARTELDASHRDFMRAAAAVDAARFDPARTAYRLVDLNSRHHYQEHRADIEAWRARRGR
jgi:hypothetical protein